MLLFGNIIERKLISFGKNKSSLQAIHMKFLVLEQEKRKKKVLKSVFNACLLESTS
jgi:hypothetical protein